MTKVVTYQDPDSQARIDICAACETQLLHTDRWPRGATGREMVDVYRGLHAGTCEAPGHGKQTLKQALHLAQSGESKNLALAANRLHGVVDAQGGEYAEAVEAITGWLPARDDREYTVAEWIAATTRTVAGRYVAAP